MKNKRRKFLRLTGKRCYRKMFVVAVEGVKTEPQYFAIFNKQQSVIIKCLKGNKYSSPQKVLKRMEEYLKKEDLKNTDEAWLVVDKDQWADRQLSQLLAWSQNEDNYGFALSNPKFEYWLLLHFEDGKGISSPRDCSDRLKRYIIGYDKSLDSRKITMNMVNNAIDRAKNRDNPPSIDWPRSIGSTTVYRLVEKIIKV